MSDRDLIRQGAMLLVVSPQNHVQEGQYCDKYEIEFNHQNFNHERIEKLFDNDSLLQQAIETPVEDALSPWRDGVDTDKDFRVKKTIIDAVKKARIYRSALILPVLHGDEDKFIPFSLSINEAKKRKAKISRLLVVHDFESSSEKENNINSVNFGNPTHYIVGKLKVDHTRGIFVKGARGRKSAAESFMYYFKKFHESYEEMVRAMGESNVWMLGTNLEAIKDGYLAAQEMGIEGASSATKALEKRLENFRSSMNSKGAYLYDKENEEINRNPVTNLDAIVKAVDKSLDVLCAAVDIVPSRFLGKSGGALNSSNKADVFNMVMIADNFRANFAEDPLNELDQMIEFLGQGTVKEWKWNPTKAEIMLGGNNA